MKRSFGCVCGRLFLCGNHFVRTTYSPGLEGSPARIACSEPLGDATHLISFGSWMFMAFGSRSAAWMDPSAMKNVAATVSRIARRMVVRRCMAFLLFGYRGIVY